MTRKIAPLMILALSIALTGCVGQGARPVAIPTETTAEALPDKCLAAKDGVIEDLQDDIAATVPGVEFKGHGVIKSESGDDFWFIAIRFEDDGATRTGTWGTMQDPTANDYIAYVAVDDLAPLVSTYKQPKAFVGTTSTSVGADDCIPR